MLTPAERRRAREFALLVEGSADGIGGAHRRPRRAPWGDVDPQPSGADLTELAGLTTALQSAGAGVEPDPDFAGQLRARLVAVASVRRIDAEPGFRSTEDVLATLDPVARKRRGAADGRPADYATHPRLRAKQRQKPLRGLVAATELPDPPRAGGLPNRLPRRVTLISGTLVGLVALSGVSVASGGANPGDALYGVKRSREAAQLALARTPEATGQIRLQLARRRLAEAVAAVGNPARMSRLLDDMDSDTRNGVADLGRAALDEHSPVPLDTVDRFALVQHRELEGIKADGTAEIRLERSRQLVERAGTRSADLRGTLLCGGTLTGPDGSDELGPRPRTCSALTPSRPGRSGPVRSGPAPSRYPAAGATPGSAPTSAGTGSRDPATGDRQPNGSRPGASPSAATIAESSDGTASTQSDPSGSTATKTPKDNSRGRNRTTGSTATTEQDTGSLLGSVPDTAGDVLGGVLDPLTGAPSPS